MTINKRNGVGRPIVDRDERRRRLIDATWKVIAREGLEKTSLRTIASEMNVTTGVIAHYFSNKQELLSFAITDRLDDLHRELDQRAAIGSGADALRTLVYSVMPTDKQARTEWAVYLGFLSQSSNNSAFRAELKRRSDHIRGICRQVIERGVKDGSLRDDLDKELVCDEIQCLVEGLGPLCFLDQKHFSKKRQQKILDALIERIATPATRHR